MTTLVRAGGLREYAETIRDVGLDAEALLARYHLPLSISDEEQLISLDAYAELLEESALLSGRPDLGMLIASKQDIHILGPLAIAMQNSATVREALETCSRYLYMQSPAFILEIRESTPWGRDAAELRFEVNLTGRPHMPQLYEQSIGDLHLIVRFLAGDSYPLRQVNQPHALMASAGAYREFFGDVRIEGGCEFGGLVIARSVLDTPLGVANQMLKQMSMNFLRLAYDSPSRSIEDQVRHILRRAFGTSQGRKQAVADLLYMHPRTLHRRLRAEGTSFEEIRQDEQKKLVLRHLRQTSMPLSHVASLAGFSEQSALSRACRHWFGLTPSAIRRVGNLGSN